MIGRIFQPLYCSSIALAAVLAVSPAGAQNAAPSADDIVQFFTKGDGSVKTRGICVGTEGECDQASASAALNMFVEFEYNSATLTQESDASLRRFSQALMDDRMLDLSFELEGHTDAAGSSEYNQSLSSRRAETVKNRLVELGVSEARLNAYGLGESEPKFEDPMAPGNRRVEISLGTQDG